MDNLNAITSPILSWLFNYAVHSSILLGLASLAQYCGVLQQRRLAELVWRTALFSGLVTASLQLGLQLHLQTAGSKDLIHVPTQIITTNKPNSAEEPERQLPTNAQVDSSALASPARNAAANQLTSNSQFDTQLNTTFDTRSDTQSDAQLDTSSNKAVIRLPAYVQELANAFIVIWLSYCVFVLVKMLLDIRQLNRMANAMPIVSRKDLTTLLKNALPKRNNLQSLRVNTVFNSPFVCPNGMICLPAWALEQANQSLCHAMLHHEIRHIVRRDNFWRIVQEFIKSVFFFQVLNRAADKQLMLLAEIDCDSVAVRANGVDTFAQALVRCAEKAVASKHPPFAIPMAKNTTLLQRIEFILDEDIMNKKISRNHTTQTSASSLALGMIAIVSLSGACYAMPTIEFAHSPSTNTSAEISVTAIKKNSANSEPTVLVPHAPTVPTNIASAPQTPPVQAIISQEKNQKAIGNTPPNTGPASQQQANEFEQAQTAYASKNFATALTLFRELAKQGHVEAQFMAGDMLWRGEGSNVDPEAATALLMQAASQGHAKAQQYLALFSQRAQHQSEINFYTQQFDGGKLKWTEQTCERPALSSNRPSAKEFNKLINQLNANLTCYNNYVASLKQSLANGNYLSPDLRRLMRNDEIEQAQQLAQNVYFDMGLQAMRNSEQLLTEFDKKNQLWSKEISEQAMRNDVNGVESLTAFFNRMSNPPVKPETGISYTLTSSNPNVSPITK